MLNGRSIFSANANQVALAASWKEKAEIVKDALLFKDINRVKAALQKVYSKNYDFRVKITHYKKRLEIYLEEYRKKMSIVDTDKDYLISQEYITFSNEVKDPIYKMISAIQAFHIVSNSSSTSSSSRYETDQAKDLLTFVQTILEKADPDLEDGLFDTISTMKGHAEECCEFLTEAHEAMVKYGLPIKYLDFLYSFRELASELNQIIMNVENDIDQRVPEDKDFNSSHVGRLVSMLKMTSSNITSYRYLNDKAGELTLSKKDRLEVKSDMLQDPVNVEEKSIAKYAVKKSMSLIEIKAELTKIQEKQKGFELSSIAADLKEKASRDEQAMYEIFCKHKSAIMGASRFEVLLIFRNNQQQNQLIDSILTPKMPIPSIPLPTTVSNAVSSDVIPSAPPTSSPVVSQEVLDRMILVRAASHSRLNLSERPDAAHLDPDAVPVDSVPSAPPNGSPVPVVLAPPINVPVISGSAGRSALFSQSRTLAWQVSAPDATPVVSSPNATPDASPRCCIIL
jgi:hypothetical protein